MFSFSRSIILAGLSVLFPLQVLQATQFFTPDEYMQSQDEALNDETWIMASSSIELEGTVTDDCFLYASNLTLNAEFKDDLWGAGLSILFGGSADDRVRLLSGQLLKLSGVCREGVSVFAKTVQVTPQAVLHGESHLSGENIIFEGHATGSVWMAATKVTVKGRVDGDLRIIAEDIVLLPGTDISGSLRYTSGKELVPGKDVFIGGSLTQAPLTDSMLNPGEWLGRQWKNLQLILFANALLLGSMYIIFCSRMTGTAVRCCRTSPLRALLVGFIFFLIIPGFTQLLIMSRYGIPAALIISFLYLFGLYVGKIITALLFGGLILRLQGRQNIPRVLLSYLVGLSILYFVMALPLAGIVVWIMAGSYGLGGWIMGHIENQVHQAVALQSEQKNLEENKDQHV